MASMSRMRALCCREPYPGRLDDRVRDRIIAETGGNPLALVELSQRMSRAERAGGFAPPVGGQSSESARGAVPAARRRTRRRRRSDWSCWRRRSRWQTPPCCGARRNELSTDVGALGPATEAGLLDVDDRVRFHHPLVRSAVYRAASLDERRRVHDALAEVSDPELAADRRAWHRALAAVEPDEAVAADLERCSRTSADPRRSRGRSGAPRARHGAPPRTRRCRQGARSPRRQAGFQAGDFEAAQRLLATARERPARRLPAARVPRSCGATLPPRLPPWRRGGRLAPGGRGSGSPRSTSALRAGPT